MTLTARGRTVAAVGVGVLVGVLAAASFWSGLGYGDFDALKYLCLVGVAGVGSGFITSRVVAQYGGFR